MSRAVVFDLDGVLLRGDATVEFVRRRLRRAPWLLGPGAVAGAGFAMSHRASAARSAWSRRIVGVMGAGRRLEDVEHELRDLAQELHDTPGLVPHRTAEALREHVAVGDRVLISSAGLEPFVRTWASMLGAPGAVVAASTLEQRTWGVVMSDHHYGHRKLERAVELGWSPPFDIVYSDSDTDLPLLQNAERPVLVRPSAVALESLPAALLDRAEIWTL